MPGKNPGMATLEDIIFDAEASIDYDLVRSPTKCRAHIAALRKLVLRRPKSVSIDGNQMSFEVIREMLVRAEQWLQSNDDSQVSVNGSQNRIYDMSRIRG